MMKSYAAFLAILCIPLFVQCMEENNQLLANNNKNLYIMQDLYRQAYNALDSYHPVNDQTVTSLLEIIKKTNKLKYKQGSKHITETDMMNYSHQQKKSFTDKYFSGSKSTYNGPHHVSIFFARLKIYNEQVTTNNLKHPTLEQFKDQLHNCRVVKTVDNAKKINLTLNKDDVKYDIILIDEKADTNSFMRLVNDVLKLLFYSPETAYDLSTQLNTENDDQEQDNL